MLVKWKRTRTNTIVCKVVLSADSAGREVGDQSCKRNEDLTLTITEKVPSMAQPTSASILKTLLRHYANPY